MGYLKKSGYLLIIFLILLLPIIQAETIVVQEQTQPEEKQGFFDKYLGFIKNPIFWYFVIGFLLLIAVIVGLFFLARWLIKFLKSRTNIFYKLRTQRIKLAKIHRRYPAKHFFKYEKNIPIRLVKEQEGKLVVTEPIAFYKGDYTSHEGNIILSLNLRFNKKWFFFPIGDIVIIPNKDTITIEQRSEKGKSVKLLIDNLPRAKDIIKFNESEVLIYAESLSNAGADGNEFFVPVLKAKDGKIIDLSLPTFKSLRDVVIGDYLFEQSDEFVKLSKQSMNLNPNLRYAIKSGDNQNVDVPSSSSGGNP